MQNRTPGADSALQNDHDRVVIHDTADQCSTYAWCTMAGTPDEHTEYHSGEITNLSAAATGGLVAAPTDDRPRPGGWWCWPVRDRGKDETVISFEGHWKDGDPAEMFDVPVLEVAAILAATRTKEGRKALEDLVTRAWEASS